MDWPRSIQLLPAELGEYYENRGLVSTAALNESSFLHSRELVRKPALVPVHHSGQCLLAELTFAKTGEAWFGLGTPPGPRLMDLDFSKVKFDASKWRTLNLPHDWAVELPFVHDEEIGRAHV